MGNDNAQGEFYLTDVLEICHNAGRPVLALACDDPAECLGVNSRIQLAEATKLAQRRINRAHMAAGVTMVDPELVWIGPDVAIAQDVELLPNVTLAGTTTSIGEDSVIGPDSRLTDTTVGCGCVVDETVAVEAQIDDGATCGPRAYLRPAAHLCEGAKAGTHVEIKKSTVGKGSKVPHLSYIGDTTIGEDVNVGAGSVTCNYDGKKKHATTIGDGAFIGSDTMMVAPVAISWARSSARGSCITKDVAPDALARDAPGTANPRLGAFKTRAAGITTRVVRGATSPPVVSTRRFQQRQRVGRGERGDGGVLDERLVVGNEVRRVRPLRSGHHQVVLEVVVDAAEVARRQKVRFVRAHGGGLCFRMLFTHPRGFSCRYRVALSERSLLCASDALERRDGNVKHVFHDGSGVKKREFVLESEYDEVDRLFASRTIREEIVEPDVRVDGGEGRYLTIRRSTPAKRSIKAYSRIGVRRVLRPLRRLDPRSFVRVGNDIRAFESDGPPSRALFLGFAFLRFVFGVEQALYDLRVMRIAGGEVPQLADGLRRRHPGLLQRRIAALLERAADARVHLRHFRRHNKPPFDNAMPYSIATI